MAAAEIRDRKTGLISGGSEWFQSRQIFHEIHETEANPIYFYKGLRSRFCNKTKQFIAENQLVS